MLERSPCRYISTSDVLGRSGCCSRGSSTHQLLHAGTSAARMPWAGQAAAVAVENTMLHHKLSHHVGTSAPVMILAAQAAVRVATPPTNCRASQHPTPHKKATETCTNRLCAASSWVGCVKFEHSKDSHDRERSLPAKLLTEALHAAAANCHTSPSTLRTEPCMLKHSSSDKLERFDD
jgi:hypothetical protein